jgi:glucose-1-phosphate adenylyltransferase
MDLLRPDPAFNLHDRKWPVRTNHMQYPPVKSMSFIDDRQQEITGSIVNSLVSGGCVLDGAQVEGSVLSPNIRVGRNAQIRHSVIMNNVTIGEGACIQNAIIDKEVVIPPGMQIGYDLALDRKRFDVTASGIVIVGKKEPVK